ncbi:hypothetical protein C8R45DRAFT_1138013 [Mycena sanguinolenta]|nr:hypothetical protein C8R45DRAFT_1138013 [Mycena sanguinolenta]
MPKVSERPSLRFRGGERQRRRQTMRTRKAKTPRGTSATRVRKAGPGSAVSSSSASEGEDNGDDVVAAQKLARSDETPLATVWLPPDQNPVPALLDSCHVSAIPPKKHSAADFMTLAENRVPGELLGEILKHVSEDDKSTLQSFSLTCRAFCGASRTRLFSRIEFTSYVLDEENIPLLPSPSEIALRIARLDFLTSTEIAPLVRDFRLLMRLQQLSCGWNTWKYYPIYLYALENALFERLVRFPGLQQLHATRIHFTQARLDILFRLPHLLCLSVSDCAFMTNTPFPRQLHLSDFSVHSERAGILGEGPRTLPWNSGNDRHLRAFGLSLGFSLRGTVLALPTFPKVHTLRADGCGDMSSWENPALRHLELWTRNRGIHIDPFDVGAGALFPHLEQYSGACQALSFFGGSPALRRIQTDCAAPEDFLSRIHAIQSVKLTALHATLTRLDNAVFNKIVEFLPHLTELLLIIAIAAEDVSALFRREIFSGKIPDDEAVDGRRGNYARSGFTVSTFFLRLSSVPFLPPGLERFAISWQFNENDFYNEHCAYKLPNFAYIRDVCRPKCPGLTWILFDGIYLMLEWRLMQDGTEDAYSTKNWNGGARRQRCAIYRHWYSM